MATPFLDDVDLRGNRLQNFNFEVLSTAPQNKTEGRVFFLRDPSTNKPIPYFYDGATVTPFYGSDATQTDSGRMSASDKAKLDAATAANTANALVSRDTNGNITVGGLTASTGSFSTSLDTTTLTASDSTLGSATATSLQTGTLTATGLFSGAGASLSGTLSVGGNLTGSGNASLSGNVSATKGIFSGDITGATLATTGDVTGANASFSGTVTGTSFVGAITIADSQVTTAKLADNSVTTPKLADNAVTSAKIADAAVGTTQIASSAIVTAKINDGAVTTPKLADNAVTSAKIGSGEVQESNLGTSAVSTGKLADGAVTTDKIGTGAVGTTNLADSAVATAKLADNSVTTAKINANAVTSAQIATNAVTTAAILDGAVTSAKITGPLPLVLLSTTGDLSVTNLTVANELAVNGNLDGTDATFTGAVSGEDVSASTSMETPTLKADSIGPFTVGGATLGFSGLRLTGVATPTAGTDVANKNYVDGQISSATLTSSNLAANSVGTTQLIDGAVTTAKLSDGAVTAAKLGTSAVTTTAISDGAVTTDKLGASAVNTVNLADGSVTTPKLADLAVTTAKTADAAITTAKLADGAIVNAKITDATIALGKLATPASATDITSALVLRDASGNTAFNQIAADTFVPNANAGFVSFGSNRVTGVATPTSDSDATPKSWVELQLNNAQMAAAAGLSFREPVRAKATSPITTLSGIPSPSLFDNVTLAANDEVLLDQQVDATKNGYWVIAAGAWSRRADLNESGNGEAHTGLYVLVEEGDTYASTGWVLNTTGTITIDSTNLSFVQARGKDEIAAGNGLVKDGLQVNVVGTANRISVSADAIDIASNYGGQTTIDTVGTVTTGDWNASVIAIAYGGTGGATAAQARANLDVPTKSVNLFGDGSTTDFTFNHGLGTPSFTIAIWDEGTGDFVFPGIKRLDANSVKLSFNAAPTTNQYRAVAIG